MFDQDTSLDRLWQGLLRFTHMNTSGEVEAVESGPNTVESQPSAVNSSQTSKSRTTHLQQSSTPYWKTLKWFGLAVCTLGGAYAISRAFYSLNTGNTSYIPLNLLDGTIPLDPQDPTNFFTQSGPVLENPIPDQYAQRGDLFHFEIGVGSTFSNPDGGNITLRADLTPPASVISGFTTRGTISSGAIGTDEKNSVFVKGPYAYVGGTNLDIINIVDPANLFIASSYTTSFITGINIDENFAYVVDSNGLKIIDISNPASPIFISNYVVDYANDISVSGSRAYVVGGNTWNSEYLGYLEIIDVSNPSIPSVLGRYNATGEAYGVAVSGDTVYVAYFGGNFHIIDVSDPVSPSRLNIDTNKVYYSRDIYLRENIVYLAADGEGLVIFDVSDTTNPIVLAKFQGSGGAVYSVFVYGDYAYVTRYNGPNVEIIDISDPENPFLIDIFIASGTTKGLFVSGNHVYIAETTTNSLEIISIEGASLSFDGLAGPDDVGITEVVVTADAGTGSTARDSFNIIVDSTPPQFTSVISDFNAKSGAKFSYTIPEDLFYSTYGDPLIFSVTFENPNHDIFAPNRAWDPSWLTFDPITRTFSGTPSQSNTDGVKVLLTAEDAARQRITLPFEVHIEGTSLLQRTLSTVGIGGGSFLFVAMAGGFTLYNRKRIYKNYNALKTKFVDAPIYNVNLIPQNVLVLGNVLGEGGFATVYEGEWYTIPVAVKKLHLGSSSGKVMQAFIREMDVMSSLRHPNIVEIYGISNIYGGKSSKGNGISLVMELLEKGSMHNYLHNAHKKPFGTTKLINLALEVARALRYLHTRPKPILHRDVKSANVLLYTRKKQLHVKLTDFGLSQVREAAEKNRKQDDKLGSRPWMAPELFGASPSYSTASDVYSLGMLLWEMVTRKIPFAQATNGQVLEKWISEGKRETLPESCPQGLATIIEDCWAQAPKKRPSLDVIILRLNTLMSNVSDVKGSSNKSPKSRSNSKRSHRSKSSRPFSEKRNNNNGIELQPITTKTPYISNIHSMFNEGDKGAGSKGASVKKQKSSPALLTSLFKPNSHDQRMTSSKSKEELLSPNYE